MVYKRCHEKGCTKGTRCKHRWYIEVYRNGDRERGPVTKYLFLLPLAGLTTVPKNRAEVDLLEAQVLIWVAGGRRPVTPPPPPSGGDTPPEAPPPEAPPEGTVTDAVADYRKAYVGGLADKGVSSILNRIDAELGKRPLVALLDKTKLREFLATVADESSWPTSNRYRARWSHLVTWCREHRGLTGDSPFFHRTLNRSGVGRANEGDGRKRRLLMEPLDEEAALVAAVKAYDDGGMMEGRLYCAIDAGLRRGEMLAVRREDILRNHSGFKGLSIRVQWMTSKTRRERYVPVTSERLEAFIAQRLKRFGLEFLFGQADGTRVDEFTSDWENILLATGICEGHWYRKKGAAWGHWVWTKDGNLTWHDLRHECGSRLAERGVPLMEVKELLGHRSLATTQKYLNATHASLGKNMRAAHTAMGL